jgi:hypothetical protein
MPSIVFGQPPPISFSGNGYLCPVIILMICIYENKTGRKTGREIEQAWE